MSTVPTDDEHCSTCDYGFWYRGHVACEFLAVTGQRRGHKGGFGCPRYKPRLDDKGEVVAAPKPASPEPPKPKKKRVPMHKPTTRFVDLEAIETLHRVCKKFCVAERECGMPKATLTAARHNGRIHVKYADAILERYGVDIVKRGD
jgi:hypothetical protein